MLSSYKYCPTCKADLRVDETSAKCAACGFAYFLDPAPTAGIICIDDDGRALVGVRATEPFKGALDTIGGFIQPAEKPEEAALRECLEETGLTAEIVEPLGTYTDTYGEAGKPTLAFHYIGRVISGTLKANDDVAEVRWVPIAELPLDQGFNNARDTFRDLQRWWASRQTQQNL